MTIFSHMSEGLIVVLEDERNFSRFLKMALEERGYEVYCYDNGQDGEEAIKNMCPDLAILDVMLPRKNGLDICMELKRKEKYRNIPILMITGVASNAGRDNSYWQEQTSADGFLCKPISVQELYQTVDKLLN
ncbi:MAG TPA: response regulator [Kiritimatiellia bacterium]|nr:response regulator [Kiritimatiellia bacterium]HNR93145.1 response regulator [Kiritimatiellia bacterium]HNS80984.1 response regulator [Kiritimatiellia bacterium]HPA77870.1 response regulator [Kiritimatiellia bacterium]HQQ04258.1 response regulator [Kiritimatiellia bacterium]